ncbi:MAG: hypothetical protein BWY99_02174 [Synergistetes bacterium ADurb.BinA166]|nr:MAG: hypothetical protein BWY99_02174 [Synergistetes bacterium ADurb.BinA166]
MRPSKNFVRLIAQRLQAVLSMWRNSLHGFEARIFPLFGVVCHLFMRSLNWTPGSPQVQAAFAISAQISRALYVWTTFPVTRSFVFQDPSSMTACMKESGTDTEWFAFW